MDTPTPKLVGELRDPGVLSDGQLFLRMSRMKEAEPERGFSPAYYFSLFRNSGPSEIGEIVLRVGWTKNIIQYGGHIGYSVNPEARGHGFAARAVRLILPLAWRHGLPEVWITCNPDNIPSIRTCERLGATFEGNVPLPANTDMYLRGERTKNRYRISRPVGF